MKLYALALVSVLFLAACSDSGSKGNGGSGPAPIGPGNFDPQAKPANPASKAYIQQVMQQLDQAKQFHPEDAAIFSAIIEGNDVRNVDYWAQQDAIRKLDPAGQDLVYRLKQNCFLNPARKTKTGGDSPKAPVVEKLVMSSEGTPCNFRVQKSVDQTTQQGDVIDEKNGWYGASATMNNVTKESRLLNDAPVQARTALVSTSNDMTINAVMGVRVNQNTGEQNMEITGTGNGSIAINFVNGQTITGPVTTWMSMKSSQGSRGETSSTMDIRTKFEGKTPQGDILIVTLMTEKGSSTYLNGELIESSSRTPVKPINPSDFKQQMLEVQNTVLQIL